MFICLVVNHYDSVSVKCHFLLWRWSILLQHAVSRDKTSEKKFLLENSSYFCDWNRWLHGTPEYGAIKKRQPYSHWSFIVYICFLFYMNFSFSSDFCTCLVWCTYSTAAILMTPLAQDFCKSHSATGHKPTRPHFEYNQKYLSFAKNTCMLLLYHNTVSPC
jgi:hypothetical protein